VSVNDCYVDIAAASTTTERSIVNIHVLC